MATALLSMTSTRPSVFAAATLAKAFVPESPDESVMHSTPSAPASRARANDRSNALGSGHEVLGRSPPFLSSAPIFS